MAESPEAVKRSIIYIRALLTLCLLLLAAYNFRDVFSSKLYVLFYLAVLIASNFVFIYLPAGQYEGVRLHYIVFLTDIILLSLGAYWMANMDFQFFITMFLTIFICALSRSIRLSLVIALVVNAVYIYMKYAMTDGGINILLENKVLLNIPFLFIVALHSSYLAENAGEQTEEKKKLEKTKTELSGRIKTMDAELANIVRFTSRVYDSLKDGLIIFDNYGVIRAFNRKCEAIFNVKRHAVLNYNFTEVRVLGGIKDLISEARKNKMDSIDKLITVAVNGAENKLIAGVAAIKDESNETVGYLCTIRVAFENLAKEV